MWCHLSPLDVDVLIARDQYLAKEVEFSVSVDVWWTDQCLAKRSMFSECVIIINYRSVFSINALPLQPKLNLVMLHHYWYMLTLIRIYDKFEENPLKHLRVTSC